MMNYINFLREVRDNFFEVGAVWPSSRFLGRAFGAPLAHPRGPMHVLEVGAGNGAITHQIAAMLQPGDCLDVIEINGRLAHDLRLRLERDGLLDRPGIFNITIRLANSNLAPNSLITDSEPLIWPAFCASPNRRFMRYQNRYLT